MNINISTPTKEFLAAHKGQWKKIAAEATTDDLAITSQWICKIMDGRIKDPGVSRMEAILNYAYSKGWKHQPNNKAA